MQTPPPPTGTPLDLPPPLPQPEGGPAVWEWWQGALGVITAFVGASVVVALVFAVGTVFGGEADDPRGGVMMFGLLVQDVAFVGAVIAFAGLRGGRPRPWMLGLRDPRRGWGAAVLWIVGIYIGLLIVGALWSLVVDIPEQEVVDDLGVKANDFAAIGGAFVICVAAPIAEELLFRGLLFPALRKTIGTVGAALVTGLAFGGVHAMGSPVGALPLLALFGALLCVLYLKTGSLVACMIAHCINNAITYGVLVDWGWQIPVLLAASIALILGAYWLVNERFGPAPPHVSPV